MAGVGHNMHQSSHTKYCKCFFVWLVSVGKEWWSARVLSQLEIYIVLFKVISIDQKTEIIEGYHEIKIRTKTQLPIPGTRCARRAHRMASGTHTRSRSAQTPYGIVYSFVHLEYGADCRLYK